MGLASNYYSVSQRNASLTFMTVTWKPIIRFW